MGTGDISKIQSSMLRLALAVPTTGAQHHGASSMQSTHDSLIYRPLQPLDFEAVKVRPDFLNPPNGGVAHTMPSWHPLAHACGLRLLPPPSCPCRQHTLPCFPLTTRTAFSTEQ